MRVVLEVAACSDRSSLRERRGRTQQQQPGGPARPQPPRARTDTTVCRAAEQQQQQLGRLHHLTAQMSKEAQSLRGAAKMTQEEMHAHSSLGKWVRLLQVCICAHGKEEPLA